MKVILSILAVLFLSHDLLSQNLNEASTLFLKGFDNEIKDLKINNEGEIVFTGYSDEGNGKKKDFLFGKIKEDGSFSNLRSLGGFKDDIGQSILSLPQKRYVIGGSTYSKRKGSKGKQDGWIICIGENSTPVWDLVIGTKEDDGVVKVMHGPDSDIIAVGYRGERNYIAQVDVDGNLKELNYIKDTKLNIIDAELNDAGDLLLIGENREEYRLMKVSLTGDLIWETLFEREVSKITDVYLDNDDYLVVGTLRDRAYREQAFVARISRDGKQLQDASIGMQWNDAGQMITKLKDGSYLLVGQSYSHLRNARKPRVWIEHLDKQLNSMEADRQFAGTKTEDQVTALLQSYTGKIIIGGHSKDLLGSKGLFINLQEKLSQNEKLSASIENVLFSSSANKLKSNETGELRLSIRNTSEFPIVGAYLERKNTDNEQLLIPDKIFLPTIETSSSSEVSIPIEALDIENAFDITIEYSLKNSGSLLDETSFQLEVLAKPFSKLAINNVSVNKVDDENYTVTLELKNIGNIATAPFRARFYSPHFVELSKKEAENFNPFKSGDIRTVSVPFKISEVYYDEMLDFEFFGLDDSDKTVIQENFSINLLEKFGALPLDDLADISPIDVGLLNEKKDADLDIGKETIIKNLAESKRKAEEEALLLAQEEAKLKAEQEVRQKAANEARLQAEEEARVLVEKERKLKAAEEARIRAEEEARQKAAQKARLLAEEEARLKAEEEARLMAKEEARLKAEVAARILAEEEARLKAKKAARLKAEEEAQKKAAEEARILAEAQAKIKAEEEARLKAEKEARFQAAERARKIAEAELKQKSEEEARKLKEAEAKLKAEEKVRLKAEAEAKLKAEEEARKLAETEARLKAEEEARLRAEAEAKIKAEEEARKLAETEARLKAEEEARLKAEKEAKLKAGEEARKLAETEARLKAEEQARIKLEQEAKLKAEEEARLLVEAEAKLKAEEEARKQAELEALEKSKDLARKLAEAEAKIKAQEEARLKLEEEAKQKEAEAAKLKTEIFWSYPDIDVDGTEFNHNHYSHPLKLKLLSNSRIAKADIALYVNDKKASEGIQFQESDESFTEHSTSGDNFRYTYKNKILLSSGSNKIQLRINSTNEILSEEIDIKFNPIKPNLFVYAIGIPYQDLSFTTKDAKDFGDQFLNQKGGLYDEVYIDVVTSEELTTKASLVKRVEDIRNDFFRNEKIKENDVVMFYVSGHGFQSDDRYKSFRIAASDFDPFYTNSYSLDFERDVFETLKDLRTKKIFFLDACYSGALDGLVMDEGAKSLSGDIDRKIGLSSALEDMAQSSNDFTFILSSSEGERSYEDKKWENGAFTEAFIDAAANKPIDVDGFSISADLDDNGVLYVSELYEYLKYRIPQLVSTKKPETKTTQTPFMPPSHLVEEKPILVIKK